MYKRIYRFIGLLFFFSSCFSDSRREMVNAAKNILQDHSAELSTLEFFSKTNCKIEYIYLNNDKVTFSFSKFKVNVNGRQQDHLTFDYASDYLLPFGDTAFGAMVKNAVMIMKKLDMDVLNAYDGHLAFGLKDYDTNKSYVVKGKYVRQNEAEKSGAELKELYYDGKSKYWLYELDSNWHVLSNP